MTLRTLLVAGLAALSLSLSAQQTPEWIIPDEGQSMTNSWLCFKKQFNMPEGQQNVTARIAADSKYWLWINGEMVIREGAVKRGPNRRDTYFDTVNLTPYLKSGEKNNISILVWYFGKCGFSYNPTGKGALFFDAKGDKGFTLVSDNTWRAMDHPAYFTPGAPLPNFRLPESSIGYDARRDFKFDWVSMDADKLPRFFRYSKMIGKEGEVPFGKLTDRVIPQFKDYGMSAYVSTEVHEGAEKDTLVCRIPYNAHVNPYLKVKAKAGSKIVMYTDHYKGGGSYNMRAEYICKEGVQEYESLGWINGEKMYYIYDDGVEFLDVKYRETSYDTEFSGKFDSDDEFCNIMFEKARRTLLVTMRDTYMDCPDRERAQWWGDMVNESGEAFYALCPKSHLLMKKGMYELIGWQYEDGRLNAPIPESNWAKVQHPGQMLAAIGYHGFWNYYWYTGDVQPIRDLYPGAKKFLETFKFNPDGTLNTDNYAFIWADHGPNKDKEVMMNAYYYNALRGAERMAELIGEPEDASRWNMLMKQMKSAFNAKFWKNGCYRSPDYTEETDDRGHALAVVYGLADEDKYDAIYKVLQTQWYASPYLEKYVMEALYMMGHEEYAIERIKKRYNDMIWNKDCSTLYEGWGIGRHGYGGGTVNHAWSGGPMTIFYQYLCGISPLEAGFKKIAVRPQPAGFQHAAAEVLSVNGLIKTAFQNGKKSFGLDVTIPEGTTAVISIPGVKARSIVCNGTPVWKGTKFITNDVATDGHVEDGYIHFEVKAGNYSFKSEK